MGNCCASQKSTELSSSKKPRSKKVGDHRSKVSFTSSSPQKPSPTTNGFTMASVEDDSIDSDIQIITGRSNVARGQPLSCRLSSVSDPQVELELANLIYGHPERDYAENHIVSTPWKTTEV